VAGLTLDAGSLIAYERGDERIREILTVAYARGLVPTIPAIVLAEVWRRDARDARVARLIKTPVGIRGCDCVASTAHADCQAGACFESCPVKPAVFGVWF
jgi:hypothetical protein